MKLYLNRKHKRVSTLLTLISIPVFMAIMPFGSFNPTEFGFWTCIVLAVFIDLGTNMMFVKFQAKDSQSDEEA